MKPETAMFAFALVATLVLTFAVGRLAGWEQATAHMERQAILHGVAERVPDEKGIYQFRWKSEESAASVGD